MSSSTQDVKPTTTTTTTTATTTTAASVPVLPEPEVVDEDDEFEVSCYSFYFPVM
jgi:hypothetical protein